MKNIAILCGGASYEHEVSIISGIQVAESLDKTKYTFEFVYFDKDNQSFLLKDFKNKKDFKRAKRLPVDFVKRNGKVVLQQPTRFNKTIEVDACYLAFHGGTGESGQIQGMLEVLGVPFTSASSEGSVIAMNKALTKEVLRNNGIATLPSCSVFSAVYAENSKLILEEIQSTFSFPVIIKPVHLGSSIAIEIAHSAFDLEKFLNVATRVDSEILIEPALSDFTEYNVSVRTDGSELQLSPIEEPVRVDAFLSFADKYANGSKKTGGKQGSGGGMELLDRVVPAKISEALALEIQNTALKVYRAVRLSGLLRIDFMYHENKLYCTEINPIPGSMSFYLWEAAGEQFKEQITQSIEDAIARFEKRIEIVPYHTDIVDKFIGY